MIQHPFAAVHTDTHSAGGSVGKLIYGSKSYSLDDRLLAHLQHVMSIKLRRGENFFVSWRGAADTGGGRHSIWVDNGVHIAMEFDGSRVPSVNREWVETMAASASSSFGLQLTDESGELLNAPAP